MNDGRVRARDAAAGAVAAPPSPVTPLGSLVNIALRLRALIALVVLVAAFALLSPEFLTTGNVTILIKHVAINAILAMGMTFVILTGGIDLSVGSVAGLVGMIAGGLISQGLVLESLGSVVYLHTWLVVVIGLAAGMACGALNGLLVARLGVAPFIATLGVLYIARGAALLVSGGATFPNLGGSAELGNTGFPWLGGGVLLGLPCRSGSWASWPWSRRSWRPGPRSVVGCTPSAGTNWPPCCRECASDGSRSASTSSRGSVPGWSGL